MQRDVPPCADGPGFKACMLASATAASADAANFWAPFMAGVMMCWLNFCRERDQ